MESKGRSDFRPTVVWDPSLVSPSARTMGEWLPPDTFADLYRLVRDEGMPQFARVDAEGNVELYLVFESVDDFSEATRDQVYLEWKTYRDHLLLIVWTLNDPKNPLGFPVPLAVRESRDRYMALRFLDQPETWIHYLAYSDERLLHIYSEAIQFPPGEKQRVEEMIRRVWEGKTDTAEDAADDEVREEPVHSVPAVTLSDDVLGEDGVAYVLDHARLTERHGAHQAEELVMGAVNQALWVMRRHNRSEVRECSFTIWVAEQAPHLFVMITPGLHDLFEVVHESEDEANPFSRFLLRLPEFVETREASPLSLGAYPIMRYERGRLYHLELDDSVTDKLVALHARLFPGQPSPYKG